MLSINQVTGGYSLHQPVIKDLSFSVHESEIVGLIGSNGAGKSTTIKHILGLLVPHRGEISVHGYTLKDSPTTYRSYMTYIPEKPQFYEELTLWEHMELTAKVYQLSEEKFRKKAEILLDRFGMRKVKDWFPSTFSKGMQQKIMILCASLVETDFLIVDEPFTGLDPLAIHTLLTLLNERKKNGTGILMSTHVLDLAEKHCDRILLIENGEIALQGSMNQLRQKTNQLDATLGLIFFQQTKGI